jgi:hypothetical protein
MDPLDDTSDELRPTPELSRLFDAARKDVGEPARVASIAGRLGAALDAPLGSRPFWMSRLFVGGLVVGAGALLWAVRAGPSSAPASAPVAATMTTMVLAAAPNDAIASATGAAPSVAPDPVAAAPIGHAPATLPARSERAAPVPSVDPVVEEHDLLARARRALDSNPAATLARVQEHQGRFPHGILASEREFLRVSALVRLGRIPEAREARDRFVAAWPTSAYRTEIDRLVDP